MTQQISKELNVHRISFKLPHIVLNNIFSGIDLVNSLINHQINSCIIPESDAINSLNDYKTQMRRSGLRI